MTVLVWKRENSWKSQEGRRRRGWHKKGNLNLFLRRRPDDLRNDCVSLIPCESPLPARMLSSSFSVLPDLLFSGFLHERQEQVDRIKVTWSQRLNYKSTTVSKSLASSSRFLRKNNNDELTKYSTLSILFIQLCRFDLLFLCRHMIGKSL